MRIAIVGDLNDLSAAYVAWLAERRGFEVLRLAEDLLGDLWDFRLDVEERRGELRYGATWLPLESLDGAFVRLNPKPSLPPQLEGLDPDAARVVLLERRYGLHLLLEALPGMVVNRPNSGRSNGSKPFQMNRLEALGFRVPRWRVTNQPEAARAFLATCPEGAIYKSSSGLRSRVRRAGDELFDILQGSVPVLLQEYIPGDDVRIHAVGRTTFATRIEGEGLDYRFDEEENRYTAMEAPEEIRELCIRISEVEGLELSGTDFRVDADGGWWCLETNPVPTFLPYESAAGHRIADTVLEHIARARQLVPLPRVPVSLHAQQPEGVVVGA